MTHVYVGAARWTGRPATTGTNGYFNGSIAEVALYSRPLSDPQVATLYATGAATSRPLTTVTRPSGGTSASITYDTATGRAVSDATSEEASRMQTLADQLERSAHQELAHQLG